MADMPIQSLLEESGGEVRVVRPDVRERSYYVDWLVDPDGNIKTLRFHINTVPAHLLRVEWALNGEATRRIAIRGVYVADAAARKGYRRLYDVYAEEGRLADWKVWVDRFEHMDVAADVIPKLDDAYLPRLVLERRRRKVDGSTWTPKTEPQASGTGQTPVSDAAGT